MEDRKGIRVRNRMGLVGLRDLIRDLPDLTGDLPVLIRDLDGLI